MQARRPSSNIFQVLKEKKSIHNSIPNKSILKYEETKIFSDKSKLRELITGRTLLQEMFKKVLWRKYYVDHRHRST